MQTERKAGEGLIQGRSVGLSFGCRNTRSQCRNTNAHTLPNTRCRNHTHTHAHTYTHAQTHIAAATPHRYTHVTYNIAHAHTNPCVHAHTHMRAHTHTQEYTHSLSLSLCRHRTGPRGLRSEDFRISTTKFLSVGHACMHTKRMERCKQELGEVAWSFEGKLLNHQRWASPGAVGSQRPQIPGSQRV